MTANAHYKALAEAAGVKIESSTQFSIPYRSDSKLVFSIPSAPLSPAEAWTVTVWLRKAGWSPSFWNGIVSPVEVVLSRDPDKKDWKREDITGEGDTDESALDAAVKAWAEAQ